ncbi:MAG: right-handed parallel beta-helix repeat-containing protein [Candidatus Binatia bacterium]|nr:right-handed parallel beta-helix repeat-containing protein [Candidatus Binatia bacterium]
MSVITVHAGEPRAVVSSLTQALSRARAGDLILLGPGHYSPQRTGELLPLRVPPGVAIEGGDRERCIIDGEGWSAPSFNPIRPDSAVLVLGEDSSIANVTLTNGGGHGLGALPGASVRIQNCVITHHGAHGVFLGGVEEAAITACVFRDNGRQRFSPSLPRGSGARQGHHIFAEARHGRRNRLWITDNTLQDCFADGIALVCFFTEADEVACEATVLRNTIVASERAGLLFSSSFGPSHNRQRLVIADNTLRDNKQFGIHLLAAVPLAARVPAHASCHALVTGNEITGSPCGVLVQGAVGEAHGNTCDVVLIRNRFAEIAQHAIRLVGALGGEGIETRGNTVRAEIVHNLFTGVVPAVLAQGAGGPEGSRPTQNVVAARFTENVFDTSSSAILVSDGREGNRVEVAADSQAYTRRDGNLLS